MTLNYQLPYLPERPAKPRQSGVTMMMDKGLSLREAEDFCSVSGEYTDLVKFGFGTSLICNNVADKLNVYRQAGIETYFGGTLFEAFVIRGMFDDFLRYLEKYQMKYVEVSDGTIEMDHAVKLKYIERLAKDYTVLSEVGSKLAGRVITNDEWIMMMRSELQAGAWKVIAEARESGTIGIFNADGSANTKLIADIEQQVEQTKIIWEAPQKNQQVWFIQHMGANVNLGNIAPYEMIPLETLRQGLRGDTLLSFLPKELL
ncbi:MAG: phosphosulfolactate synthase [Marinilabiliaceae bacterium]|nr:phosphosulfolactate synthase [Marinilabiliaceae bacterium]